MQRLIRPFMLACLLVLATSTLSGCVKFKQVTTVMPDGSGKIDLVIGLSEQLTQMAKQQGEDPFADFNPKEFGQSSKGLVAFTKPTQKEEGGYTYLTLSAYFEDINAVELNRPDDSEEALKFVYTRDGNSATLSVENSMIISAVKDYEPVPEEQKPMIMGMTAGMVFSETYRLPGAFEDIKGVTAADKTATIEMDQDNMLNATGPLEDLKGIEKLVFKISGIQEDDAAMQAFKKEMQAAIAEWEQMKE